MRLLQLHDLLATLARASPASNPAQIMLDLVAYNSGHLRNMAALNVNFRVCGKARELLATALDGKATINDPQAVALLRIRTHIDTSGALSDWTIAAGSTGPAYCSWTGVSCSSTRQVTDIGIWSIHTTGLKGRLPPAAAFHGLSSLTTFTLAEQPGITGTLPADWSQLRQLRDVRISEISARGSIPSSWGRLTSLVTLDLHDNQLTGIIPARFGALTSMRDLRLSKNRLVGSIPSSLADMRGLRALFLWGNQLTGRIPQSFAALTSLQTLEVSYNLLVGSIPALHNLKDLTALALRDNQLTGTLPGLFSGLLQLTVLDCQRNKFVGTLPESYRSLTKLVGLTLSENDFNGTVPASWSAMLGLRVLSLYSNPSLGGCLPSTWQSILGTTWDIDGEALSGTCLTGFCRA